MMTMKTYPGPGPHGKGKSEKEKGGKKRAAAFCLLPSLLAFTFFLIFFLAGCGDHVRRPAPEELARFQATGQASPTVDMNRVLQAKIVAGPYRAVPGDVLRLEMPRFLEQQPIAPGTDSRQTYNCRIGDDGTIVLPIIGTLAVQGKSLAEIESAIAAKYYPKYVAAPLPVFVSVLEYQTQRVSIVGAVTQPGIHALRHDQMSLVGLLMQAGGIAAQGAAVIRINRAEDGGPKNYDGLRPSPVLRPLSAEGRPAVLRAVFEREGPLRTTGWLNVEQGNGRVSVRDWLDIGNEPQRREFLGVLASKAKGCATEDLGTRLTRLGAYLDGLPTGGQSEIRLSRLATDPQERNRRLAFADMTTPARAGVGTGAGSARVLPALDVEPAANLRFPIPDSPPPPGWRTLGDGRFVTAMASDCQAEGGDEKVTQTPGVEGNGDPNRPEPLLGPKTTTGIPSAGAPTQTLVLPVRGLNIPFADVVLEEGDTVVVEPPREQSISVVGLVTRPGNMPYPPGAQYNLIQAIAFAGGLDLVADPRYVSVYRLAPDGEIVSTTFQLVNPHHRQQLTESLSLPLRPGDVVSVEHTLRTRTNVFFDRVFRISLGLYVSPERLWND